MKYMGSKRAMLGNGLGDLIQSHARNADRIVDPFCGSGVVAWYAAENTDRQVIASDLQEYAVALSRSVTERDMALNAEILAEAWFLQARAFLGTLVLWEQALRFELEPWENDPPTYVARARSLCVGGPPDLGIWRAYGGHYFSPLQALTLDALRRTLPAEEAPRSTALAALIGTASACAAAPGHTAQPFQATQGASTYLFEAWRRNPFHYSLRALEDICPRHAQARGIACVRDALDAALDVHEHDLVIIDPPYSSVHYSRFYHVLETIAKGTCGQVNGVGRYPPVAERPKSLFSIKTAATLTLAMLLERLSARKAKVILTFPAGLSSNGLSGEKVIETAERFFVVAKRTIESRFSTLGGNKSHRPARQQSEELILLLVPKTHQP